MKTLIIVAALAAFCLVATSAAPAPDAEPGYLGVHGGFGRGLGFGGFRGGYGGGYGGYGGGYGGYGGGYGGYGLYGRRKRSAEPAAEPEAEPGYFGGFGRGLGGYGGFGGGYGGYGGYGYYG
nr:neuropeptide-like protein 31 [Procambarus clarkii]